jgi:transposase
MAAPYSQDLRVRVVAAVNSGSSASAAARQFGIGISTAIRWGQRWRAEGHANARAMGGDRRSRLKEHRVTLLTLVAEQPDMTIAEVRTALTAKAGIQVGVGTICRFFALHKLTLKKRVCTPPSKGVQTS